MSVHLLANNVQNWIDAASSQWPFLVVFLGMPALLFRYMMKQHAETIKSKDDEIERLVEEKRSLQAIVFGQPLSTTDTHDADANGQKSTKEEKQESPKEQLAEKPKKPQRGKS